MLDRRQVEVGQKAPTLLGIPHVTLLARDRVGAFAALESEHDGSPWIASEVRARRSRWLVSGHDRAQCNTG